MKKICGISFFIHLKKYSKSLEITWNHLSHLNHLNYFKDIIHSRFISSMWRSKRDRQITEISEAVILQLGSLKGKHHRGKGKYSVRFVSFIITLTISIFCYWDLMGQVQLGLTLPGTLWRSTPVERRIEIVTVVRKKLIRKRPRESISHLSVRKVRHT